MAVGSTVREDPNLHRNIETAGGVVTFRAIGLGLAMVLAINVWISTSDYLIHSSSLQLSHFPIGLLAVFLVALFLNGTVRRFRPGAALQEAELLTILAMGFVGAILPTHGITGFLMGVLGSFYYHATPENQWAHYLHHKVPQWAIPSNEHGAMTFFFEGLPEGRGIPYEVWLGPMCWWLAFLVGLGVVFFCIAVILHRQWVHHERLLYPLAAVGTCLALRSPGRILPDALRGGHFWAGFCLSFGSVCWNILGYFSPMVPRIPVGGPFQWTVFVRGFPRIHTRLNLYTMGFAYFASLNILFSIWFFFVIFWVESGILNRVGFVIGRHGGNFSVDTAVAAWQGFGALTVLVCWGLWTARFHLKEVFASAFGKAETDDSGELLSYRAAVFGLIGGLIFVVSFLYRLGIPGKFLAVMVPALVINYLAVARIVAETGLIYMRTTVTEQYVALFAVGTRSLLPGDLTGMSLTYSLVCQGKGIFMTPFTHAVRIADFFREHRRRLAPAIALVVVVGLLADLFFTARLGYAHGASNFSTYPFSYAGPWVFNYTVSMIRDPFYASWERTSVFAVGAAIMSLLTALHYRFPGWPLHPIGFPVSFAWTTQLAVFSIFVVWGIKSVILRTGGVLMYRRWQPFFLGILAGWSLGVALSFVVDAVWFPGQGHYVHGW
ncbi:MAG: hypothetical protein A3F84_19805 [Candidatus Handelsmanbacteria bacterium RIFCSPLOWO2_12_FULL_64_10]|uniref:Peptide transporter n=1 Tax=Handelsmanbacteria sp. (strain RIFCSPLOWO2_12_FULL_64_10) TaxID=1817868 RepID=A0A1F6CSD2_HANXR|nr:MAG: hypothetical protein A3F84_19805 [Candidatus Handelsmanbacteria bacterium RIFCSPLOWO2_12_FULL_64_10]